MLLSLVFPADLDSHISDSICDDTLFTDLDMNNLEIVTEQGSFNFSHMLGLLTMGSIVMIVLLYMLSKFLPSRYMNVSMWAKENLSQTILSFFIFLFLAFSFKATCLVSSSFISEVSNSYFDNEFNSSDYYSYSQDYLRQLLSSSRRTTARIIEKSLSFYLKSTEYRYWGAPFIGGGGVPKTADRKAAASRLEMYFPLLAPVISSFKFQIITFEVLKVFKVSFFLIAILLRFLPFTRDAGNVLIALFFALYIIYPITMLFNALSYQNMPRCLSTSSYLTPEEDIYFSCNYYSFVSPKGVEKGSLAPIAIYFPQAFFLPNLSILITFTSAKALFNGLKFVSARVDAI